LSPEELLCHRVLELAGQPGVAPMVAADLRLAVVRYRGRIIRRRGRWWAALAMLTSVVATGWMAWHGLLNLYRMELARSVEPLYAVAWGLLGIAELAAGVWFLAFGRRMFGHWRSFRGPPP
jgi:hypothetical protein